MTGDYRNWLVNHLGQKDALNAHIAGDKSTKEVKSLKGDMVSKGDLRAIIALEDSDKKVVDKALTTKNLLQVWWGHS